MASFIWTSKKKNAHTSVEVQELYLDSFSRRHLASAPHPGRRETCVQTSVTLWPSRRSAVAVATPAKATTLMPTPPWSACVRSGATMVFLDWRSSGGPSGTWALSWRPWVTTTRWSAGPCRSASCPVSTSWTSSCASSSQSCPASSWQRRRWSRATREARRTWWMLWLTSWVRAKSGGKKTKNRPSQQNWNSSSLFASRLLDFVHVF